MEAVAARLGLTYRYRGGVSSTSSAPAASMRS
jgi:hypothetical protein